jgi:hypothetical protein
MPSIEPSGSTSAPLTKRARDQLLAGISEIQAKFREVARTKPQPLATIRSGLSKQKAELLLQYFVQLPRHAFGRCPVCNVLLEQAFDPWGLDGFWWQEQLSGSCPKPSACEHFRVLTGALNLNGKPPLGGEAESYPGPEVPYVIPKVLELPGMVAVISSIPMTNGYTAYPISYFSQDQPPTSALANPWTKRSCNFTDASGEPVFTYKTDPWDFELLPWIVKGRVKWIEPGDPQNVLKSGPAERCPFIDLKGLRLQQVIKNGQRSTKPTPHREVINPFSE